MKAVSSYKAMIEELGKMVWVFANFQEYPFKEMAKEQGWTLDYIKKIQGKVQASTIIPEQIKEELIGDGDEAKFVGRLRTAFFELGADPNFALSYYPEFDEACFALPSKDNPDKNKDLIDALIDVYGDEAAPIMVRLESICQTANNIVQHLCSMLEEICRFVDYTPEPQQDEQEPTQEQTEPQQITERGKVERGRGRPTELFKDKMIEDANGEKLVKIHKAIAGKKGKDAALIILASMDLGWLLKPTYTQVKNEFGDIGSSTGYNRYLKPIMFTKEEIEGAKKALSCQ